MSHNKETKGIKQTSNESQTTRKKATTKTNKETNWNQPISLQTVTTWAKIMSRKKDEGPEAQAKRLISFKTYLASQSATLLNDLLVHNTFLKGVAINKFFISLITWANLQSTTVGQVHSINKTFIVHFKLNFGKRKMQRLLHNFLRLIMMIYTRKIIIEMLVLAQIIDIIDQRSISPIYWIWKWCLPTISLLTLKNWNVPTNY